MYLKNLANGLIEKPTSLPDATANSSKIAELVVYSSAVAAVISVLIIVIAGIQFVISSGEPGKVAKARNVILYAVVGLVIALSATAIASFFARSLS